MTRRGVKRLDFNDANALMTQGAEYVVEQARPVAGVASVWTDSHPENLRGTR